MMFYWHIARYLGLHTPATITVMFNYDSLGFLGHTPPKMAATLHYKDAGFATSRTS